MSTATTTASRKAPGAEDHRNDAAVPPLDGSGAQRAPQKARISRGDPLQRLERQLGVERDLEHLARQPLRDRQVAGLAAGRGHRRLQVDRPRVVDRGRDPARGEVRLEAVAIRARAACRGARRSGPRPARAGARGPAVPSRSRVYASARSRRSAVQRSRCGSLTRSTAACSASRRLLVPTHDVVVLGRSAAVVGDLPHAGRELGVVRRDDAGVAVGAQVLARVEAEAGGVAQAAGPPSRDLGAVGLRRVLEHGQAVALGDRQDRRPCRRVAVEVDRQDHLRARRDRGLELPGVHREGGLVHVDEDRPRRRSAGSPRRWR